MGIKSRIYDNKGARKAPQSNELMEKLYREERDYRADRLK